jgi:hypothetical protein
MAQVERAAETRHSAPGEDDSQRDIIEQCEFECRFSAGVRLALLGPAFGDCANASSPLHSQLAARQEHHLESLDGSSC